MKPDVRYALQVRLDFFTLQTLQAPSFIADHMQFFFPEKELEIQSIRHFRSTCDLHENGLNLGRSALSPLRTMTKITKLTSKTCIKITFFIDNIDFSAGRLYIRG